MADRSLENGLVTAQSAPELAAGHSWTPGFGLPGSYYWDERQYQEDLERVFCRNWLFAGHTSQIPEQGDYFSLTIGRDSLLIVRDETGEVRALFNSCRHRGSQLCEAERGRLTKFVCPYHQWVYGLDGTLQHCRLMNDEVDKPRFPLHRAHVEVLHGLIFVCLAERPPGFAPARELMGPFLEPHVPERIKPCLELDYHIKANWKTIFDNNRECYHCAHGHKEFCLSNFDFGMPGDSRSSEAFVEANAWMQQVWSELGLQQGPVNFPNGEWFRCMRFPLKSGYVTESLDGEAVGPVIGDFPNHNIGSLRVVGLPNMWFHFNSDYVMTTRLIPVSATETKATVVWFVHEDAQEGVDYDPQKVADVWRLTSEQDWKLCEMNQAGLESTRYVPGPLSKIAEQGITHFIEWYFRQLGDVGAEESVSRSTADRLAGDLVFEPAHRQTVKPPMAARSGVF